MNLKNVKLIFGREMRDQLRDRRTLFMIAVLPLLFYPLLGYSFFQIAQFLKTERRILVIGYEQVKDLPDPFGRERQDVEQKLGSSPQEGSLEIDFKNISKAEGLKKIEDGTFVAMIYFAPDFKQNMQDYLEAEKERRTPLPPIPKAEVYLSNKNEGASLAGAVVDSAMQNWSEQVEKKVLKESSTRPAGAKSPVQIQQVFIGGPEKKFESSLWSKILPFVLLIWAVTGAFYPAVDLCAGEKERGTLETLLTSPAQRVEVVFGKMLTVMIFSSVTAILNLLCMGLTGWVVMSRLHNLPAAANVGPPPLASLGWLVLMLLPVSALFSAVCLALAAFARSTKEGQYYLMPVILVTMPLILVPMAPSVELTLGTSLIPVSGIVLLMRATMEGTIGRLWPYAIPVTAMTLLCCWLAIRWAVDQFSSESVLFREGERWDLQSWTRHLIRDREPTPSVGMAVLCGALILVLLFFFQFLVPPPAAGAAPELLYFFKCTITMLVSVVAAPAIIMALILTRDPARTLLLPLRLNLRSLLALPAAALLAILLFPVLHNLAIIVQQIFPLRSPELEAFSRMVSEISTGSRLFWIAWGTIALTPAICEELAFRGFILSGLRHQGHKWRAIVFSAIMFGVAHGLLQQSIMSSLLGCVLGYIAIQSGSLWSGAVYHFAHNSFAFLTGLNDSKLAHWCQDYLQQKFTAPTGPLRTLDWTEWWNACLYKIFGSVQVFRPNIMLVGLLGGAVLLLWFSGFSYRRTEEEALQETIEREAAHSLAG